MNTVFGLHVADIFVLVLYLLGMAAIGLWTAKKIKQSNDFFMPRRFGKAMMVMFGFGAGTHSDQAVGVASKSFSSGLSGIWYQWLWLPCTPFYWLIAPVMRRFRAITTGDVFEARYNRSVAMLYAVIGMLNLSVNIGLMLRGSSEVISASTRGLLSANVAIAVMTVVFVIYGVAGGLAAAIITDFIQGILTIIFSFLLLPLVMNAVGWMNGIRQAITDPQKLTLVAPAEIGFFYITVIAFNALVGIVTQPHTMSNCAAGKTEMEGRFGWMFGNIIKRICTIPWCLTGLAAIVYFGSRGVKVEPDKVFGAVAGDFLPQILPGMLGVFLAALLASVMSSCDAFMIASSALFTENIYRPLSPDKSERHYVTVGRIAAVAVVCGGVVFAYWLPGVVAGLEIFWKISAMMGLAFWMGLFWRRTTVAGAWALYQQNLLRQVCALGFQRQLRTVSAGLYAVERPALSAVANDSVSVGRFNQRNRGQPADQIGGNRKARQLLCPDPDTGKAGRTARCPLHLSRRCGRAGEAKHLPEHQSRIYDTVTHVGTRIPGRLGFRCSNCCRSLFDRPRIVP
jgi:Na+/proline symporter